MRVAISGTASTVQMYEPKDIIELKTLPALQMEDLIVVRVRALVIDRTRVVHNFETFVFNCHFFSPGPKKLEEDFKFKWRVPLCILCDMNSHGRVPAPLLSWHQWNNVNVLLGFLGPCGCLILAYIISLTQIFIQISSLLYKTLSQ